MYNHLCKGFWDFRYHASLEASVTLINRDVGLKHQYLERDLHARPYVATAQIENRPQNSSTKNPRYGLNETHVFIVSFGVVYRLALKVLNNRSIKDNYFIFYPSDLHCNNMHEIVPSQNLVSRQNLSNTKAYRRRAKSKSRLV